MDQCILCGNKGDDYGIHYHSGHGGGICDVCAESNGCDCGCFPSPTLQWHCQTLNIYNKSDNFYIDRGDYGESWIIRHIDD